MDNTIVNLIYKAHLKLMEIESVPREYGPGEFLFSSEVHTICAIGKKPGINLTGLALDLEVSKSAVSKFVSKLLKKNYITKERSPDNLKEVIFNLTDRGHHVVIKHREYKEAIFGPLISRERELEEDKRAEILSFLKDLYKLM